MKSRKLKAELTDETHLLIDWVICAISESLADDLSHFTINGLIHNCPSLRNILLVLRRVMSLDLFDLAIDSSLHRLHCENIPASKTDGQAASASNYNFCGFIHNYILWASV